MPRWYGHLTQGAPSLSLRQGCLLSEPGAGEGCPLEAEDPLVGREGDHFVGGAEDP